MKKKCALLLLCCLALTGCAAAPQGGPAAEIPEEKRLILYTSHKTEVYLPIVQEFERRTGIWI